MCGRFTLTVERQRVTDLFDLIGRAEAPEQAPRYNIAPTQPVLALRLNEAGKRELVHLRWGLIPSWAEDPAIGNRLINARSETAAEKPSFRSAFRQRRCLVPADGFYEWLRQGSKKQPYCIRLRDARPFAFAGLWERWRGPDDKPVETCTLLTTEANELVRPLHERMPVILPRVDFEQWLDPTKREAEELRPLLRPYPSEEMKTYPVSLWVNNPRHEGPQCLEPVGADNQ